MDDQPETPMTPPLSFALGTVTVSIQNGDDLPPSQSSSEPPSSPPAE